MTFLSATELAQLRADALATLADETCTILTPTTSANAIGERVLTWGTVSTAVACRLRPAGRDVNRKPSIQALAGQENVIAQWAITLPSGTTINPGDRIVIDAVTYEVAQSWDEETWRTASRVDVTRIE